ncbi:DUF4124 domain-containing protein [Pseudomonas graminis]|uniref:DUF4124 domain-containing protein n=1 Tax=Pseudomonas graminis TaxID=158627 RepID=UPI002349F6AA|nr:DUF4124 domain-containing protein [Pseudomonas graminis]MDC6381908.1 DUF4124 domain-containing protein [Pseudomonas graminis]
MSAGLKYFCQLAVALCLLFSVSQTVLAQVYTYIDANGNRVFTDQPHRNAKKVEIAPTNRVDQPTKAPSRASKAKPAASPIFHYQLLRILAPEPDSTVRDIEGNLNVTVSNDPELQPDHLYRLLLDSKPYGEPTRSPVFPLTNIDRGTHQLSVEIIDQYGRVLERTPNQPFHLVRISLAQKRLAQPCKTDDYGVRPECPIKDKPEEKSSFFPFFR